MWVGIGQVYTLPVGRIAGIYAPANGEFSTPPFALPEGASPARTGLTLNVDAKWSAHLITGGCDEGCQAYVFAELIYAGTSRVVPGYVNASPCAHLC